MLWGWRSILSIYNLSDRTAYGFHFQSFRSFFILTVNSILVFIVCALSAGVLIPLILLISFCRNLFDMPDERKIHQGVVPRLGGIAFKSVVFFSVALLPGMCQF